MEIRYTHSISIHWTDRCWVLLGLSFVDLWAYFFFSANLQEETFKRHLNWSHNQITQLLPNLLWLTHSLEYEHFPFYLKHGADFRLSLKIHCHVLYNLDILVWTGLNYTFTFKRKYLGFSINHKNYKNEKLKLRLK